MLHFIVCWTLVYVYVIWIMFLYVSVMELIMYQFLVVYMLWLFLKLSKGFLEVCSHFYKAFLKLSKRFLEVCSHFYTNDRNSESFFHKQSQSIIGNCKVSPILFCFRLSVLSDVKLFSLDGVFECVLCWFSLSNFFIDHMIKNECKIWKKLLSFRS